MRKWRSKFENRIQKFKIYNVAVEDTAAQILDGCMKKRLSVGRKFVDILDCSIYAAMRIHEYPLSLSRFSEMRRELISMKTIELIKNEVLDKMNLKMKPFPLLKYAKSRAKDMYNVNQKTFDVFYAMVEEWEKIDTKGYRNPDAILATILYHVGMDMTDYKITQEQAAKIFGTSSITIRSLIEDIEMKLGWFWEKKIKCEQ